MLTHKNDVTRFCMVIFVGVCNQGRYLHFTNEETEIQMNTWLKVRTLKLLILASKCALLNIK